MKRRYALAKGLLLIASLVTLVYAVESTHIATLFTAEWADAQAHAGVAGELLFIGAGALFTALGLPLGFSVKTILGLTRARMRPA